MVSDAIVVRTVPADGSQAHIWTGFPDGTYTLEPLDMDSLIYKTNGSAGTTVILEAKKGEENYYEKGVATGYFDISDINMVDYANRSTTNLSQQILAQLSQGKGMGR